MPQRPRAPFLAPPFLAPPFLAPMLATIVAAAPLSACESRREPDRQREHETPRAPSTPATPTGASTKTTEVSSITDAPRRFLGREVRLVGDVDEVLGDRAFVLEGAGWAFDDNITVLAGSPLRIDGAPLAKDDEVIVDGTVRELVIADIERELGWDLEPELEIRARGKPVLVADSIRRVGELGRWRAKPEVGAPAPVVALMTIVTAVDPIAFAGRSVHLRDQRVLAMMGKGLWIGPSVMGQIYVIPRRAPEGVLPGDHVDVRGTLERTPKDAAAAWELPGAMAPLAPEGILFIDDATITEVEASTPGA